jgi:hypothetical protein
MAHVLIVGQTESGKTTAARRLALEVYQPNNRPCLVLDPFCDPAWRADFITDNPDQFLKVVFANEDCALFVDEGPETVGRYGDTMKKLGTMSRHWGHVAHFITQRAVDIDKTMRSQCSALFLFNSDLDDCKDLAKRFNEPQLVQGVDLEQGGYFYKARFAPVVRANIFTQRSMSA